MLSAHHMIKTSFTHTTHTRQSMFGLVKRIQSKGPAASAVRDMVCRMRREAPHLVPPPAPASSSSSLSGGGGGSGRIDRIILLDREVDLVTPLMTQITLEGLIDEVTGISAGAVPWQQKGQSSFLLVVVTRHARAPSVRCEGR